MRKGNKVVIHWHGHDTIAEIGAVRKHNVYVHGEHFGMDLYFDTLIGHEIFDDTAPISWELA